MRPCVRGRDRQKMIFLIGRFVFSGKLLIQIPFRLAYNKLISLGRMMDMGLKDVGAIILQIGLAACNYLNKV